MPMRVARWWALPLVMAALAAAVLVPASAALAADDYPYQGGHPDALDSRGFNYRHCTSFVAFRMSQRGAFYNHMKGPNGLQGRWFHARNWADNAQRIGFGVDTTPARGAIAHWYAGEGGAKDLGHVAFVDQVNPDGSVYIEEYNGASPFGYSLRGPLHAPRYIHVYDDPPTAPDAAGVLAASMITERTNTRALAPAVTTDTTPPVGELTAPLPDSRVAVGQDIDITGEFSDDGRVARVSFYVADQSYRWKPIGDDAHGGSGTYGVRWRVDYPPGTSLSFYAEAIDEFGNHAIDSVRGLEAIEVVPARGASLHPEGEGASGRAPQTFDDHKPAAFVGLATGWGAASLGVFLLLPRRRVQ